MSGARERLSRAAHGVAAVAAVGALSIALAGMLAPPAAHAAGPEAAAGPAASASESDAITPAEKLVFTDDHLHGVSPQTELDYSVVNSGEDKRQPDTVRVLVLSPGNQKSDAQVSDHSGAVKLPGDGLPCNPVVIYFLERDIADMEQLTGGRRQYFQKRVRLALASGPRITKTTAEIGGKRLAARQIVVQPYLNDPNAERFPRYTGKRYTFVFADDLPGRVALIKTEVPGANGDFAHPVQTETLTFQGAMRKLPAKPGTPGAKPLDGPSASR